MFLCTYTYHLLTLVVRVFVTTLVVGNRLLLSSYEKDMECFSIRH